jgi:hypothetical protein
MAKINRRTTIAEAADELNKTKTEILLACSRLNIKFQKGGESRNFDALEMEMLREYFESESESERTESPSSKP